MNDDCTNKQEVHNLAFLRPVSAIRSLCKAAAIQQLMSAICRVAQRVLRVVPCAMTLLSWADKAASYVLAYTVAFIGIYGLSFKEGTRTAGAPTLSSAASVFCVLCVGVVGDKMCRRREHVGGWAGSDCLR